MKAAVIVFPGSNCDQDCRHVLEDVLGARVRMVFHKSAELEPCDLVVLPGGFSYGDYLRAGAIARFAPIMRAVREHADRGGLVLGICNGFQILLEARMLEGAMRMNVGQRFVCRDVCVRVERSGTAFTRDVPEGTVWRLPVAHHEGCWTASEETARRLDDEGRIVLRYCAPDGAVTPDSNPNGSVASAAGVLNASGNVLGLMPHPERASERVLGNTDGLALFRSVQGWLEAA